MISRNKRNNFSAVFISIATIRNINTYITNAEKKQI